MHHVHTAPRILAATVNHHTLTDVRIATKEYLDAQLSPSVGAQMPEGLIAQHKKRFECTRAHQGLRQEFTEKLDTTTLKKPYDQARKLPPKSNCR
jgi:hypothetical protein